jgi:acetyl esterase/lipase
MRSQLRPLSLLTVLATVGITLLATPRLVLGQEATFVQKTFTYKVVSDTEIQADIYRAEDDLARPVLVWIHGGALMFGTRRNPPQRLLDLCRIAGFVLVSIDYRLAPTVTLPAIIEDLEDAFAWIRHEGPRLFGADPDKLAVAGASAGGYLTMTSGFRIRPRPMALVSYWGYGALDTFDAEPSEHYRTSAPIVTEEEAYSPGGPLYLFLRQNGLWTKVVSGFDPTTQQHELEPYAPIWNVTPEYPPIVLIHGTNDNDVPHEESVATRH